MVGALTCSAWASAPRVTGRPPKTSTDSAEARAAVSPIASSSRRSRRSRLDRGGVEAVGDAAIDAR